MPMQTPAFTRASLLMFAGPLVWAVHFLFIYGFVGILCARPAAQAAWFGIGVAVWIISFATLAALGVILLVYLHEKRNAANRAPFIRWLSGALGGLSSIAIVWETVPVFVVQVCG